jgi:hypothetical protein
MATKEKTKKRQTASKTVALMKKPVKIKRAEKRVLPKKNIPKKKAAPKRVEAKKKVGARKTAGDKTAAAVKKQVRRKNLSVDTEAFALEGTVARSGDQSGDLQGLSNVQGADSESVDELLIEEGNTFEAEAVKGVEDAGDADEAEVRTHEVPQDDVPGEYPDKK